MPPVNPSGRTRQASWLARVFVPPFVLGEMLVDMVDETARHAGHMDIVRELIDGAVGRYAGDRNIIEGYNWSAYQARVEAGAREAQERAES
jgi:hypothetical protein